MAVLACDSRHKDRVELSRFRIVSFSPALWAGEHGYAGSPSIQMADAMRQSVLIVLRDRPHQKNLLPEKWSMSHHRP
jgi:hypothetical protein